MLIEPTGSDWDDSCQKNNVPPPFFNINLCVCETGMAEYSDWVAGSRDFSVLRCVWDLAGLIQTPIQWVPRSFSPGLKLLGREADHIPPSTAEVKYS